MGSKSGRKGALSPLYLHPTPTLRSPSCLGIDKGGILPIDLQLNFSDGLRRRTSRKEYADPPFCLRLSFLFPGSLATSPGGA